MNGIAGYAGWRWFEHLPSFQFPMHVIEGTKSNRFRLYIIEGLITIVFAVACFFLIPKSYETAYFLNDDDKKVMRLRAEQSEAYSGGDGHFSFRSSSLPE